MKSLIVVVFYVLKDFSKKYSKFFLFVQSYQLAANNPIFHNSNDMHKIMAAIIHR